MKKGQGMSINMIIIAAIALLVLIIGAILIMKSGKNVDSNAGASSCLANGGTCKNPVDCPTPEYKVLTSTNCVLPEICCQYGFGG